MKRVDPTEWANKKKAQLERAKQLREERKNQIGSNDTFSPQINPPRRLNNGGGNRGDSLDNLTHEVTASRPIADDIMEQPLPGQRNRQQQQDTGFEGIPSPGSDTLGKELRRYGGAPSNPSSDTQPRNLNNTHFKSKFMQQYDQPEPSESLPPHRNSPKQHQQNQPDNDEIFMNQLRGGNKRSNGSGWNDDTSFAGFDSSSNNTRRAAPARTKPVRPSVYRTQQNGDHDDYNNSGAAWDNSDQPAPPRNRIASGVQTKLTPRTAGEVRSNLSLLKSKIRQSESAGKTTGSFGGQGRTLLGGSGGFEPEEEFQTSMGARQGQNGASVNRGSSKASFGSASHTNSNVSFNSYASGYDDQPEEPLIPRNRATHPRPRGIAADQQGSFSQPTEYEEDTYSNNYNSKNVPSVSKSQPQNNRQQAQSNEQKRTNAGYEPSVGIGRGLNGNNPGRNNNYGANNGPPSTSIDDVPAVVSRANNNKFPSDAFPPSSMGPSEEDDTGGPQMECPTCGRHFNPNSFQKHVKICEKVFVKKRKAFDSSKMRVQDNPELLKILAKSKNEQEIAARKAAAKAAGRNRVVQNEEENFMVPKPKPKMTGAQEQPVGNAQPVWKQQSNAFREAMKAARAVKVAMETGAPLPAVVPSGPDPSLIPCPHCGRRFNAKAADRHIPQCQNIKAKPSMLKRGSGVNAASGVGVPTGKGKGRF